MHLLKIVQWILIVVGGVITVLVMLCALLFWYMSSGVFGTERFDKGAWNAPVSREQEASCYRGGMAKDIRDNVLSSETTKEDVIVLLGSPEGDITKQVYKYDLGMCSGLRMDYDDLRIYFDDQGHYTHAKIVQN
ncbi:hypothetical protein [Amphritea pacifica]|uniref:Outer membrane protein assembly factor BamE n=1 Tax=Amphritea pacifica TaxID=2811233 RepID=A0ABS2WCB9_9GAMM|nr:hypothetical protein [Amphritea pacifica]MBN0989334.1 hypothetical protein [Amphritea pacifica]MBN0989335.1 hypothetical protein [Amphritea pacifica]MBN1008815.1 hypothetical protein [Amphritea pacifica]